MNRDMARNMREVDEGLARTRQVVDKHEKERKILDTHNCKVDFDNALELNCQRRVAIYQGSVIGDPNDPNIMQILTPPVLIQSNPKRKPTKTRRRAEETEKELEDRKERRKESNRRRSHK